MLFWLSLYFLNSLFGLLFFRFLFLQNVMLASFHLFQFAPTFRSTWDAAPNMHCIIRGLKHCKLFICGVCGIYPDVGNSHTRFRRQLLRKGQGKARERLVKGWLKAGKRPGEATQPGRGYGGTTEITSALMFGTNANRFQMWPLSSLPFLIKILMKMLCFLFGSYFARW